MPDELDGIRPESEVQPFADLWSSYLQQPNDATEKMLESLDGCTDPQAWRRHLDSAGPALGFCRGLKVTSRAASLSLSNRAVVAVADRRTSGSTGCLGEPALQVNPRIFGDKRLHV